MSYLQLLEDLLSQHVRELSRSFRRLQLDHVQSAQMPDGGFRGRQGCSDLYYTDFALRLLILLDPDSDAIRRAAGFVADLPKPPYGVVECFCLLNSVRLLDRCSVAVQLDRDDIARRLLRHALADGGFRDRSGSLSAYHTFIAALAHELLQRPVPAVVPARGAIAALQAEDGGFSDKPGQAMGQTSATAAAVGFLILSGGILDAQARQAVDFLASMQAGDGGLPAHAQVAHGDLLSTFTGLVTLGGLDSLDRLDLPAVGRFLRAVALPTGGFSACPSDDSADVEYTYCGIGCMALLRAAARSRDESAV